MAGQEQGLARKSEQELEPHRVEPEMGPELEPRKSERLLAREPCRAEQVEAEQRRVAGRAAGKARQVERRELKPKELRSKPDPGLNSRASLKN